MHVGAKESLLRRQTTNPRHVPGGTGVSRRAPAPAQSCGSRLGRGLRLPRFATGHRFVLRRNNQRSPCSRRRPGARSHGTRIGANGSLPLSWWADVTVLDENGKPVKDPIAYAAPGTTKDDKECRETPPLEICWLLSVHYAEESIGPVTLNDPCSCDRHQWDQVCETVRYSLTKIDCTKCCARSSLRA